MSTRWARRPPLLISSMALACFMPLVLSPLISKISSPTYGKEEDQEGKGEEEEAKRWEADKRDTVTGGDGREKR